jgi:hypothetical protein
MDSGEHLAVGAPVTCVPEFAIVDVKLPPSSFRPVFDVKELAILAIAGEPTAVSSAPPGPTSPPSRSGRVVQTENAIDAVIQ